MGEFLADGVVVGFGRYGVVGVAHNALVAAYVAAKCFFECQIYGFEIAIGYCETKTIATAIKKNPCNPRSNQLR